MYTHIILWFVFTSFWTEIFQISYISYPLKTLLFGACNRKEIKHLRPIDLTSFFICVISFLAFFKLKYFSYHPLFMALIRIHMRHACIYHFLNLNLISFLLLPIISILKNKIFTIKLLFLLIDWNKKWCYIKRAYNI